MHTVYCAITSEFLFAYTGCYSIFRISQTRAQRLRAPQESGMQINHQRIHATRQDLLLEDREAGSKTASRCETVTLHTHCTKTATSTGRTHEQYPASWIALHVSSPQYAYGYRNPELPAEARGGMCGDGGNRTPVQQSAPNSSPSAVYGFISRPPGIA